MFTKYSLDLRLARDLQLGEEARDPHRPSIDGVVSFTGRKEEEKITCIITHKKGDSSPTVELADLQSVTYSQIH